MSNTIPRSSVAEPARVCGVSFADQPYVVLACDGHNDSWPEHMDEPDIFELSGRLYAFKTPLVTCVPCLQKEVERLRVLARPPSLDRAVQAEVARAFGELLQVFVNNAYHLERRAERRAIGEVSELYNDESLEQYNSEDAADALVEFGRALHVIFGGRIPDEVPRETS